MHSLVCLFHALTSVDIQQEFKLLLIISAAAGGCVAAGFRLSTRPTRPSSPLLFSTLFISFYCFFTRLFRFVFICIVSYGFRLRAARPKLKPTVNSQTSLLWREKLETRQSRELLRSLKSTLTFFPKNVIQFIFLNWTLLIIFFTVQISTLWRYKSYLTYEIIGYQKRGYGFKSRSVCLLATSELLLNTD